MLSQEENINKAYIYALYDRLNVDYFCNFFEIEFYHKNKEELISEIKYIINNPDKFETKKCFSYYFPKTNVCLRRAVYLNFRDLVIRYLLISVILEILDYTLINTCFSFRKNQSGKLEKGLFIDYYKEGWIPFVKWQSNEAKKEDNRVLVRTDISSFYDTISHHYLIECICKQLGFEKQKSFIVLLTKLLSFKVIGYSFLTSNLCEVEHRQGLPISNNTEGFLANLFLKDIDEAMQTAGVSFGRYVDDYKIFASSREQAIRASLILQELLFNKGLNLNSAKTKLIEGENRIKEFIKESAKSSPYFSDIPYPEESKAQANEIKSEFSKEIDTADKNVKYFDIDQDINTENYEDFCLYLDTFDAEKIKLINCKDWKKIYLYNLFKIVHTYPYNKRCLWLNVKFLFEINYTAETEDHQRYAIENLFKILENKEINLSAKARILHYLNKPKKAGQTYLIRLCYRKRIKEKMLKVIEILLNENCLALQLNSLYSLYLIEKKYESIVEIVKSSMKKPIPEPIQDAIFYISELNKLGSDVSFPSFYDLVSNVESEFTKSTDLS